LRYAPLTLTTLAALIPDEIPAEVRLFDEGIEDLPADLDADLVGMTVITGTAPRAYRLAAELRGRGVPVVLGGPHPTLVPDEAAAHADSVVLGYAEDTWPQLLRDFREGVLRPRYEQSPELSLADRPFARRDMLPRRRYTTTSVFEATRGCRHGCSFCVVPTAWGRKQLQKPVGDVIADIRQTGARKLIFVDLNLTSDRDYARELFAALVPLRVQWYGLATVHAAWDEELLALLRRSGCRGLLMGLESARRGGLVQARKGFCDPARYPELTRRLHEHGIALQGCFVFGFDEDDTGIFDETASLTIEARIDLPRFAILTPFPATPLHQELERQGRILTRDWELYDGQHVVFRPSKLSPAELQRGTERAWRAAYSVSAIARRLRSSPAPWPVALGANVAYRHYGHNLSRFYTCDWFVSSERASA
jgi:radical SAM superfamily enzyme YgiQ (UPF0313 family)